MIQYPHVLYLSERSAEHVIGIHIEAQLSEEDIQRYRSIIEGAIAQFGKVNLLFKFENISSSELDAIWNDLKFTTELKYGLEQIALVGNRSILRWAENKFASIYSPVIRFFSPDEYEKAWEWVEE